MSVDVVNGWVRQNLIELGGELGAVDQVGVDHGIGMVVGAERERSNPQDVRDVVGSVKGLSRGLADKDGVAGAIRIVRRLVDEVQQQHGLAWRGVAELDPVREAGRFVGGMTLDAMAGEQLIGRAEERTERGRVKAADTEWNGDLLS